VFDRADAQHCVPAVRRATDLAGGEIEQRRRRRATSDGQRGHCDRHDGRQNLGRPKYSLLLEGPQRVMGESRCPTSS
jgi:hypothetical protein